MKKLFIKIRELLSRHASGKKIFLLFLATQVVYGAMLLFSIPRVLQHSTGMQILDLLPTGYSAEYVQRLFETLGEIGREVYLFQQIPLDMIYPALFAITYSLLLTFLFKRVFSIENRIQNLNVLPIIAGLLDYLENFWIVIMLSIYPIFKSWLAYLTSVFTVLKSISVTLVFVLLIIVVIMFVIKKLQRVHP